MHRLSWVARRKRCDIQRFQRESQSPWAPKDREHRRAYSAPRLDESPIVSFNLVLYRRTVRAPQKLRAGVEQHDRGCGHDEQGLTHARMRMPFESPHRPFERLSARLNGAQPAPCAPPH